MPFEPTIGIDIGVPVQTRRIQTDPASQTRSLAIAFVAIIAVLGVILVAMLISRMGDDGGSPAPGLSTSKDDVDDSETGSTPEDADTPVPAGASGLEVTPGIVPNVTGETAEKARLAIAEAGYVVKERHDKSTQPKGTVVQQSPAPNVELQQGLEVTIVISDGP